MILKLEKLVYLRHFEAHTLIVHVSSSPAIARFQISSCFNTGLVTAFPSSDLLPVCY